MDAKTRILKTSRELFFSTGFSGTTVEDISAGLGISKKTFYKTFPDKNTLLHEVIFSHIDSIEEKIKKIMTAGKTPLIKRFKGMTEAIIEGASKISPVFLRDVRKNAPELWEEINKRRKGLFLKYFSRVIKESMELGLMRKDLDKELVILVYLTAIENVINPQVLSEMEYSAGEVIDVIITMFFEGLLTDKGRKNLKQLKQGV